LQPRQEPFWLERFRRCAPIGAFVVLAPQQVQICRDSVSGFLPKLHFRL
jgi:hypothetical protein